MVFSLWIVPISTLFQNLRLLQHWSEYPGLQVSIRNVWFSEEFKSPVNIQWQQGISERFGREFFEAKAFL